MNIPSHYQSAFFQALGCRDDVDLRVVYFNGASQDRAAEGWSGDYIPDSYEAIVEEGAGADPAMLLSTVPDWQGRIHIISGNFNSELIGWFCRHDAKWCHWSEMPGIRLAELLGFRASLFRLLNPLMLSFKNNEGRRIKKHALGAFGQGRLAHRSFRLMGVPERMIADLYYVPSALDAAQPCAEMLSFSKGRRIFLSVGALCHRKGIDVLLKAFARLKTQDWCLVLCGLDRENGRYQKLANALGVQDQVLFLGAYKADRIAEVYSAADVFLLASRFDGWGAVLNEGASLGLPLIGTDLCGASWHVIDEGKNGFRVGTGSVNALRRAMDFYVRHPDKIGDHGKVSRERFFELFSAEDNAERLVAALQKWKAV